MKNETNNYLDSLVIRSDNTVTVQVSADSSRAMLETINYYLNLAYPYRKKDLDKKIYKESTHRYRGILTIVFKSNSAAANYLEETV